MRGSCETQAMRQKEQKKRRKNIRSDFPNIMKREKGEGIDNVSGTDNKHRKLQAGGYNGLLSGENER